MKTTEQRKERKRRKEKEKEKVETELIKKRKQSENERKKRKKWAGKVKFVLFIFCIQMKQNLIKSKKTDLLKLNMKGRKMKKEEFKKEFIKM